MSVLHMDCVAGMRVFGDATFDSIVCDPPYELGFMGKTWDSTGIANSVDMWREALRVLKPGGHLLAFSGSRTYHRMTCAIEDAGFEIRDQIMWLYGSGFPKSLDVSKALDKAAGAEREIICVNPNSRSGKGRGDGFQMAEMLETAPATDAAKAWQGWGTALKPAHEPICVARKPLIGTVAANVLAHGTGAINIDASRIGIGEIVKGGGKSARGNGGVFGDDIAPECAPSHDLGRWPANIIHDGSEIIESDFASYGIKTSGKPAGRRNAKSAFNGGNGGELSGFGDSGSVSRFFYCAKASKTDRDESNVHPTVKPTDLMRYLCRLVTPPGGIILDPFAGSGSTGKAAKLEGFHFIGFEQDEHYAAIANARIERTAA